MWNTKYILKYIGNQTTLEPIDLLYEKKKTLDAFLKTTFFIFHGRKKVIVFEWHGDELKNYPFKGMKLKFILPTF